MTDAPSGLNARDDLLWIVAQWPLLQARLIPGGGNALGVAVQTSERPSPINVHVSDLLMAIEESARFYGRILMDETTWEPSTSLMPTLLAEVAGRYGHFTEGDERMALDFCDDAHQYREKVRKTLERPAPPTYIGPCPERGCAGELCLREGKDAGTCPECGAPFTLTEQRAWLDEQMADRLMTASEITRALKVLGFVLADATVRKWIERKRLVEAVPGDGLYRLADAKMLADKAEVSRGLVA